MLSIHSVILALALSAPVFAAPVPRVQVARAAADFGKCSTPEIIFADGLDNRKETSFEPKDLKSFNHGSAQNSGIITQFVCDTLVNSCGANAAAHTLCQTAQTAAAAATPKTGAQADAFNAVFGIKTDFNAVQPLDDQGRAVGAAGAGGAAAAATPPAAAAAPPAAAAAPPAAVADAGAASAAATGGAASFGKCSAPEIIFQTGLDNRKETAFEPKDLKSFPHTSAQNINIISQFICDTFTNSCGANAAAKSLCTQAQAAASAAPAKTGAQADAFNKVFGISSDFAAVQAIDDQGRPVGAAAAANQAIAVPVAPAPVAAAPPAPIEAAAAGAASFGKCSAPEIIFAAGLDNRKETAFEPKDKTSFPHDSAQNIAVITQFICNTFTNTCGANEAAKSLCTQAQTAAGAAAAKTGAQADAWNKVFGISSDFAAVQEIDDTGKPVGAAAAAAPAAGAAAAAAPPAAAAAAAAPPAAAAASSGAANFGTCSTPEIDFQAGLDGRKETAFQAKDQKSFNHGSADNIAVITGFICQQLGSSCKANAAAQTLCTQATAAANAATAKTGAQADAFNAVFGVKTDFTATKAIAA